MFIEIRPFESRDASELLAIFESNVPQFFGKNETEEFTVTTVGCTVSGARCPP